MVVVWVVVPLLPLGPLSLRLVVDFQVEAQLALLSHSELIHHLQHLGHWLCHHPEPVSQAPQAQF